MKAKDYLGRVRRLKNLIRRKEKERDNWREMALQFSKDAAQPQYDPNRATSAPYEKCIIMAEDLEGEIEEHKSELGKMRDQLLACIIEVDDVDCRMILQMRYVNCMTWEEIICRMNYSASWVYKKHGDALSEIEGILKYTVEWS